jgi:hypothetical protein
VSIRLVVSDTVSVPVNGLISDADGKSVPFSFTLKCKRLSTSAFKAQLDLVTSGDLNGDALMSSLTLGWSGVQDGDGKDVEFSEGALAQLWEVPGISGVAFGAFIEANNARGKAKN